MPQSDRTPAGEFGRCSNERQIQLPNSASQIFITGEVSFLDKNILFYLNACRELIQNVIRTEQTWEFFNRGAHSAIRLAPAGLLF